MTYLTLFSMLYVEVAILVEAKLCFLMSDPPSKENSEQFNTTTNFMRITARGCSSLDLALQMYYEAVGTFTYQEVQCYF